MPTTMRLPDTAKVKIFSDAGKLRASPWVRGSLWVGVGVFNAVRRVLIVG